jgi:hypothetical protein
MMPGNGRAALLRHLGIRARLKASHDGGLSRAEWRRRWRRIRRIPAQAVWRRRLLETVRRPCAPERRAVRPAKKGSPSAPFVRA